MRNSRTLSIVMAILVILSVVLAACTPAASAAIPTPNPNPVTVEPTPGKLNNSVCTTNVQGEFVEIATHEWGSGDFTETTFEAANTTVAVHRVTPTTSLSSPSAAYVWMQSKAELWDVRSIYGNQCQAGEYVVFQLIGTTQAIALGDCTQNEGCKVAALVNWP